MDIILGSTLYSNLSKKIEEMIVAEAEKGNMLKWKEQDLAEVIAKGDAILAITGKEVIGFTSLHRWSNYSEICALVVSPLHRRKGVGTALVAKALYLAQEKYPDKAVILLPNKISFHISEKLGFIGIDKESLDKEIWELCNSCKECKKFPACHCQPMILK